MAQEGSWVRHVMDNYTSTDPPKGIFTTSSKTIADAADVEGVAPKGLTSWQRMVLFHRNRGGKGLTHERRQTLQHAIHILSQRRTERQKGTNGYAEHTLLPHKLIKQKEFGRRLTKEIGQRKKAEAPLMANIPQPPPVSIPQAPVPTHFGAAAGVAAADVKQTRMQPGIRGTVRSMLGGIGDGVKGIGHFGASLVGH